MKHQFHETVVSQIRRKFWIPHLRRQLRKVVQECQTCRIKHAKPAQPMMGPLPAVRLEPYLPAFTHTGLDYFGYIHVLVGRRLEKRWVALFVCMVTRAVHVEVAHDCSTDALILCLRNFMNICGKPRTIASDNGTNFVGFDGEVKSVPEFFDTGKIKEAFSPPDYAIEWKFNTPGDPSAGGAWERLVQTINRALKATLNERTPQEHTLRSLLYEAMNIVNSRPLTHLPVSSDNEPPLTRITF